MAFLSKSRARARTFVVTSTIALAMAVGVGGLPAHALTIQIGQTIATGWYNVNHVPASGCTNNSSTDGSNGLAGHRAVNTVSKFQVLTKVAAKQVHIHINTDATYDVGAAEAAYLWPKFYGTQINCTQVAPFVGQDQFHVFRTIACSPSINAAWRSSLTTYCNVPDSQIFSGNGPSAFSSTMLSAYSLAVYPGSRWSCATPDGARSEERFAWPGLNTDVGKQSSPIGTLKVTIDAITVDAGVSQQRVIDPTTAVLLTGIWNTIGFTFVGTFGATNWLYTTTARNGQTILDVNKYANQVDNTIIGGIQLNLGGKPQPVWQYLTTATAAGCALNPDAKTAYDSSDNAVAESVNGAMRNLFDALAGKPAGTDVLCTAKQPPLCAPQANLFLLTKAIWNSSPDHGTALIKGFIGQLLG
jgi:hypothetical protein